MLFRIALLIKLIFYSTNSLNSSGQLSRYKHLGKAGSSAYLEAVTQILRRAQIDGLEQAIKTLKAGLQDLGEEAMKNRREGSNSSRK